MKPIDLDLCASDEVKGLDEFTSMPAHMGGSNVRGAWRYIGPPRRTGRPPPCSWKLRWQCQGGHWTMPKILFIINHTGKTHSHFKQAQLCVQEISYHNAELSVNTQYYVPYCEEFPIVISPA